MYPNKRPTAKDILFDFWYKAFDDYFLVNNLGYLEPNFFPLKLSINLDKVYKKLIQPPVISTSELALKKIEKHNSSIPELRHKPFIPSQLGPNRSDDWLSAVDYLPSERYNKMISSTAAYRAGDQLYGWINTESEEYLLKKIENNDTEELSIISFGGDLLFDSSLPIRDSNLRINEDRPKLKKYDRITNKDKSPSETLEDARKYLTVLLTYFLRIK
ncbi:9479_t:CDS:2 [Entrophospora sp. SA101]|nr:9479_t:CDS:2 [Entrophospora sp. SA101]